MSLEKSIALGPVCRGTLAVANLAGAMVIYQRAFDLQPVSDGPLSTARAEAWGLPELAGVPQALLAASPDRADTAWLRLVQVPRFCANVPLRRLGWLALEVLVRDVRALAQKLAGGDFEILGEPRPLAVSPAIWAMQVAGPSGEVLYLTEVSAEVPPFQLPAQARFTAERLFIPVLATRDRDAALAQYEKLADHTGLRFETRVSVLHRAFGLDPDLPRPVAVLQLAGRSLIEIDHLPEAEPPMATSGLPAGIAMVSVACSAAAALPANLRFRECREEGESAEKVALWRGPAGEWLELLHGASA